MKWARRFFGMLAVLSLALALHGQFRATWFRLYDINGANLKTGLEIVVIFEQSRGLESNVYVNFTESDQTYRGSNWPSFTHYKGLSAAGTQLQYVLMVFPHWLTNLIAWSLFFILWRKRRKHTKGHCQRCGYDLTGNESGACPECNTIVAKQQEATKQG